jgi:transcriptional antiterminator RfaH
MSNDVVFDGPLWYVIHTRPREEFRALRNLDAWSVETFFPMVKEPRARRYGNKPAHTAKPLFPRYIFARFNAHQMLHKVNFTRGVQGLVQFGGAPLAVDEEILKLISSRVGEDGFVKLSDELKPGDKVTISDGPFKNFVGIVERHINESDRVRILLMAINYQSHITIEQELLKKVGGQHWSDDVPRTGKPPRPGPHGGVLSRGSEELLNATGRYVSGG